MVRTLLLRSSIIRDFLLCGYRWLCLTIAPQALQLFKIILSCSHRRTERTQVEGVTGLAIIGIGEIERVYVHLADSELEMANSDGVHVLCYWNAMVNYSPFLREFRCSYCPAIRRRARSACGNALQFEIGGDRTVARALGLFRC